MRGNKNVGIMGDSRPKMESGEAGKMGEAIGNIARGDVGDGG